MAYSSFELLLSSRTSNLSSYQILTANTIRDIKKKVRPRSPNLDLIYSIKNVKEYRFHYSIKAYDHIFKIPFKIVARKILGVIFKGPSATAMQAAFTFFDLIFFSDLKLVV